VDAAHLCEPGYPKQQKDADNNALKALYNAIKGAEGQS
jgi:hypothetical protein